MSRSLRNVRVLVALVALVAVSLVLVPSDRAGAADGDTLRHFTAEVPACSVSTGIAFDGDRLYLSCWGSSNLYAVSVEDGSLLATIPVSGVTGIGALAWDGIRQKMWACDSSAQSVHLITIDDDVAGPPTAQAAFRFDPPDGCIDGLAYDGLDDSLFTSGDVRPTIHHWTSGGELLDTRDVSNIGCGSSGIAVGGGDLFLANNGCSQIYRAANEQDAIPTLFAGFPRRIEDMECDDVTFATEDAPDRTAVWAQDAYDAEIYAFELGAGDCGFGGLPAGDFVMVALGDSYQSGEGVGNSITSDAAYRVEAYENGSNYADQVGPQEDTYTRALSADGNACHRALDNYAKLNRTRLSIGSKVVLVDETCSGARIETSAAKPPVVGDEGETYGGLGWHPDSQVADTLERLGSIDMTGDDVDFVTVGMGGNDAGFGSVVQACVVPSLLKKLVEAYPDTPGNIEFAAERLANCWTAGFFSDYDLDQATEDLTGQVEWGQQQLLAAFPNARIMHLNYPSILPSGDDVSTWCGGIQRSDLDNARKSARQINDALVTPLAAGEERLEYLDIGSAFGPNPLCPANDADQLANGLSSDNVDLEIERLLDDEEPRGLLDTLVERYETWEACTDAWPFRGISCPWGAVVDAWDGVSAYLEDNQDVIISNVVTPPSATRDDDVALDRASGLFHPNAEGFEVVACRVRFGYADDVEQGCLENPDQQPPAPSVNGFPWGWSPFEFDPGTTGEFEVPGFGPGTPIVITYYSEAVDLGTVVADGQGVARVELAIPDVGPGVHRLTFAGEAAGGVERVVEARVDVGGTPVPGETFGVYLCCFDAGLDPTEPIEFVDVTYLGTTFTEVPDPAGGILLDLPIPRSAGEYEVVVRAESQLTGQVVVEEVVAGPSVVEWGVDIAVPPSANGANAGRAVPVDFVVRDGNGNPFEDAARLGLQSSRVACGGSPPSDTLPAQDAGSSDLRYRGDGGWRYVWKTDRGWEGTCRELEVLIDGEVVERLSFDFR